MYAIEELRQCGYSVHLVEGKIKYRRTGGTPIDPERVTALLEEIRRRKPEAVAYLESEKKVPAGVTLALSLRPDGRCYACGNANWWLSVYGVLVCATCHPPATAELVRRYVSGEEAAELVRLNEGRC